VQILAGIAEMVGAENHHLDRRAWFRGQRGGGEKEGTAKNAKRGHGVGWDARKLADGFKWFRNKNE
jgi:hypothetical protein